MGRTERRTRMQALRERVANQDVHRWTAAYVRVLAGADRGGVSAMPAPAAAAALAEALRSALRLTLLHLPGPSVEV